MPVDDVTVRGFFERLLGWTNGREVDLAERSVELAATHRAALVLSGACDLVPVARTLHRRIFGDDRTFAIADPRRGNVPASVRVPASYGSGMQALDAVRGGSLCVRSQRLPRDFASVAAQLRYLDDVLLMVCTGERDETNPLLIRPAPIRVPPLAHRVSEIPRIIDEYALDAIAELDAAQTGFAEVDHAWVRAHASESFVEIEKATLRLVAIRALGSPSAAAARLGMAPVSLLLWLDRRKHHGSHR